MSMHPQNNISKAQLMQHYQTEVYGHQTRKAQEKQDRITQERQELNRLQKELEDEKKYKQQSKTDLMNTQKAEYDSYLSQKKQRMRELSLNPHRKKDSEPQGTYKISGENREIRRKNYDEALEGLNLNPTRRENNGVSGGAAVYNTDYAQQRSLQMQAAAMNRGRSQGYNILNHEAQEKNSKINHYEGGYANANNNNLQRNQQPMQAYNQAPNIEGLENLENYELEKYGYGDNYEKRDLYASDNANEMEMNKTDYRNSEIDTYKKMYEEHMRKMQMDQQALNSQNYTSTSGVNRNGVEQQQREFLSKQANYNGPSMSELENNFNALNIDNQEILYRKPTYHNAPSQENNVTGQQKLDKQKAYRDYLNMQVLEKGKNNPIISEPVSRLNKLKNNNIQENPYSNRNRDLGTSSLNSNPISGGNNYGMNYPSSTNSRSSNPYLIGNDGRETPSTREKLRMLGNNIMK